MQKFIAEDSFWELFPDAAIGIIVAHDMKGASDIDPSDAESIRRLLSEANEQANQYLRAM